jgi:hypothetical protein
MAIGMTRGATDRAAIPATTIEATTIGGMTIAATITSGAGGAEAGWWKEGPAR